MKKIICSVLIIVSISLFSGCKTTGHGNGGRNGGRCGGHSSGCH